MWSLYVKTASFRFAISLSLPMVSIKLCSMILSQLKNTFQVPGWQISILDADKTSRQSAARSMSGFLRYTGSRRGNHNR
jgi:hypothetical protein